MRDRYLHFFYNLKKMEMCECCSKPLDREMYVIHEFNIDWSEIDPNYELYYRLCPHCDAIYYISIRNGTWSKYKLDNCLKKFHKLIDHVKKK